MKVAIYGQNYYDSVDTPSTLERGQKVKPFFSESSLLQIKLKGMKHRASCKHIFCPYTHHWSMGGVQCQTIYISERSYTNIVYQN